MENKYKVDRRSRGFFIINEARFSLKEDFVKNAYNVDIFKEESKENWHRPPSVTISYLPKQGYIMFDCDAAQGEKKVRGKQLASVERMENLCKALNVKPYWYWSTKEKGTKHFWFKVDDHRQKIINEARLGQGVENSLMFLPDTATRTYSKTSGQIVQGKVYLRMPSSEGKKRNTELRPWPVELMQELRNLKTLCPIIFLMRKWTTKHWTDKRIVLPSYLPYSGGHIGKKPKVIQGEKNKYQMEQQAIHCFYLNGYGAKNAYDYISELTMLNKDNGRAMDQYQVKEYYDNCDKMDVNISNQNIDYKLSATQRIALCIERCGFYYYDNAYYVKHSVINNYGGKKEILNDIIINANEKWNNLKDREDIFETIIRMKDPQYMPVKPSFELFQNKWTFKDIKKRWGTIKTQVAMELHSFERNITFANGLVSKDGFIETNRIPFSPFVIQRKYNPNAKPVKEIDRLLKGMFKTPERIDTFLRGVSYMLSNHGGKVFTILEGQKGDDGKSTMINLLRSVVGAKNTTEIVVEKFLGKKSESNAMGPILDKTAVFGEECGNYLSSEGAEILKSKVNFDKENTIWEAKNSNARDIRLSQTYMFVTNHLFNISMLYTRVWNRLNYFRIDPWELLSTAEYNILKTKEAVDYMTKLLVEAYIKDINLPFDGKRNAGNYNDNTDIIDEIMLNDDLYQRLEQNKDTGFAEHCLNDREMIHMKRYLKFFKWTKGIKANRTWYFPPKKKVVKSKVVKKDPWAEAWEEMNK